MWLGVLVEGVLSQPWSSAGAGSLSSTIDWRVASRTSQARAGVGAALGELGAGTGGDGQSVAPDRELVGERPLAPCLPEHPSAYSPATTCSFRRGPGRRYTRYIGGFVGSEQPEDATSGDPGSSVKGRFVLRDSGSGARACLRRRACRL